MSYLEDLYHIKGKVIVITGGTGILGSRISKGFLSAGAQVIVLGTNEEKLNKKLQEFKESGDVYGYVCNVLEEDNIRSVNEKIKEKFKKIDILINAAGGQVPGTTAKIDQTIFDMRFKDFNKVTDLNLYGTVLPTLIFGRTIAEQKNGSIINISSMASYRAITRVAGYSAAKAAVENFTRWMAVEMALKFGDGIRVNAIAPGFFISEQNKAILLNKDGSLTDRGESIIRLTPFKRFGEPEELIGITIFLASDAAGFLTGTVIPIDGGFSAFSGV